MTRLRHGLCLLALLGALLGAGLPSACLALEYGDVAIARKTAGMDDIPAATFPHWIHRMQYKCAACHDELLKMKAGSSKISMDAIQGGKSCGVCHNGKDAFESNFDTCPRCHHK